MSDSARRSTAAQFFAEEEESAETVKVSVYDKVNALYTVILIHGNIIVCRKLLLFCLK